MLGRFVTDERHHCEAVKINKLLRAFQYDYNFCYASVYKIRT